MQPEQKHPADELAKSLARAGGILTLLSGCYETETGGFATGNSFVHESIVAIEAILAKANDALGRLYQTCDLTVVRQVPVGEPVVAEEASASPVAETAVVLPIEAAPIVSSWQRAPQAAPMAGSYLSLFGPGDDNAKLADRLDHLLVKPVEAARTEITDRPAESYDELLQKLTAVADKAAFQAHGAGADRSLVPALEGLRADFIKLRGAA